MNIEERDTDEAATLRQPQATVELDGSQGEGGGQILRTALALSMVTGRPLALARIRARRPRPGLMRQHLACVEAAAAVSGATVEGARLGAESLCFAPGAVRAGDHRFAVSSAGSCLLVLQTVLPALLLADGPSELTLSGGTHNPMAPCFHFLDRAFAPLVARTGAGLSLTLKRCGFYPAGGGLVQARIVPAVRSGLRPFDLLARGELVDAGAECLAPGLAGHVATRELDTLGAVMGWSGTQLRRGAVRADEGPGNALVATLAFAHVTEVFTAFGEKGVGAEEVARRLGDDLRAYLDAQAPVGPHLADQLALLLALATWQAGPGASARFRCSELTSHTRTNCAVIERFLPVRFAHTVHDRQHELRVVHAAVGTFADEAGAGCPARAIGPRVHSEVRRC